MKRINGNNDVEKTVIAAIKNNIAVYAAHTNLDNVINGVNGKIADKLGLTNSKVLAAMFQKQLSDLQGISVRGTRQKSLQSAF